jgi:hypothetical protein
VPRAIGQLRTGNEREASNRIALLLKKTEAPIPKTTLDYRIVSFERKADHGISIRDLGFCKEPFVCGTADQCLWVLDRSIVPNPRWNWHEVWLWLGAFHTLRNCPLVWQSNRFKFLMPVDIGLFALSLSYGLISGTILTLALGAIILLTKSWTSLEPDWPWLWLWTVSLTAVIWRAWAKRKAREAWEGKSNTPIDQTKSKETQPKRLGIGWKLLIVFLAAIIGQISLVLCEGLSYPDSGAAWGSVCGRILGGALVFFLIGAVFAFIRGALGAVVGALVIAILSSWSSFDVYIRHKPERELVENLQKRRQEMNDLVRSQLERSGYTDVPPTMIQNMVEELSTKSKELDPQTKATCEALVVVVSELMKPVQAGRTIWTEIGTEQFQDPRNIQKMADIDARLDRLQAFRDAAQQLLIMYPDLDVRLKAELVRRNLTPLQIKDVTDNSLQGAHLDVAIPLARSNVDYADLLIRKFTLLRREFGHWYAKDTVIYFAHAAALSGWNDSLRQLFKVGEQRESLERKLASLQQK